MLPEDGGLPSWRPLLPTRQGTRLTLGIAAQNVIDPAEKTAKDCPGCRRKLSRPSAKVMSTSRLTTTSMSCVLALALGVGPGVAERGTSLRPCGAVAILPGSAGCETTEGCRTDCCRTHLPEQLSLVFRGQQRGTTRWLQRVRQTTWDAELSPPRHHAGEWISERCPGSTWGTLPGLRVRLNI